MPHTVVFVSNRLIAHVVAALIDGNNLVVLSSSLHLMTPCQPKITKAVNHNNEGLFAVGSVVMCAIAVGIAVGHIIHKVVEAGAAYQLRQGAGESFRGSDILHNRMLIGMDEIRAKAS